MTTSTAEGQPPATTAHAVASHEWSEAFGDLDLEYTAPDSPTTHSHTAPTPAASSASPDQQLNIVEPLWFLQTDEEAATRPFADDGKSRWREILNFRVDRQHLAHLDLLARCHHKLGDLPAALSFQQQMVALRPSISNLLLLARMMAENHSQTSDVSDCTVQRQARAAVLMRCIELCPVHAPAWHELGLVLLALSDSAFVPGPPASHPSSARCCSRESFLWSARLVFSLVADLTNFTLSPSHPAGDIPSLSRPLYSSLLASAQRHIDQLNTQLPAVGSGKKRSECTRCVGVCKCWRQQLHRFACLPLASLFVIEKGAESARVEGSKRAEKRGGKRRGGEEDDSEDETTADVDQFDILNL